MQKIQETLREVIQGFEIQYNTNYKCHKNIKKKYKYNSINQYLQSPAICRILSFVASYYILSVTPFIWSLRPKMIVASLRFPPDLSIADFSCLSLTLRNGSSNHLLYRVYIWRSSAIWWLVLAVLTVSDGDMMTAETRDLEIGDIWEVRWLSSSVTPFKIT